MAKRSNKRGRWRGSIGYLLSFFFGVLLTLGAYAYLTRERPPGPEAFSQKVFLVDQIIQSQLYEIGIPQKDISRQSASKKEKGFAWKESILKIQAPRTLSLSLIEEHFKQSLSSLGKNVALHSLQSGESLQLDIRVQGRTTHHLAFVLSETTTPAKAGPRPKIALVIDDLGGQNRIATELLEWDLPLTLSILPFTAHAKSIAQQAHEKGKEVILHLPMEPHGYPKVKPGEGVLLEGMDEGSLCRQLSKDIEAVPYVKGASNHMGSRLMEDPEKVKIILSELKRRDFFFLDSRTTPQTVGLRVAQGLGMKAMERSLYIDHSLDEEDIREKIEKLIHLSLSTGRAIGIGHPHPETIKSLKEMIPKMKEKGIEIVPLSSLME